MDELIAAAHAAADAAGAVIRPYFRAGLAADLKSDQSPVTRADREAEAAMRAVIAARFPADGVLGEEAGLSGEGAARRWVLDPIDGTRGFITGRPTFGTLIGVMKAGVPVLGVLDQPITRERWIGAAGRPTRFSGLLGGAAGCRVCPDLSLAELSCTTPDMFPPDVLPRWHNLASAVRRVTYGSDCYAYGLLALGQIDVIAESSLKVWDWAALVPVIEGAGGRMTDWNGERLRADGDGRVLAVGDPALLDAAVRALRA
jgi:myo-inositol-1(or 4)-monophosphatase